MEANQISSLAKQRVTVPFLDLRAQYSFIRDEIRTAIERVIESQHFILGAEVEAVEHEVAAYSQCKYGIGVSSGTDALLVSLMAIGIKPGDEVITTPYTFFATAGSVARLGAKPIFVDIDLNTYNIDPACIEAEITDRTKAIIPVHLYGQMVNMEPVMEIADRYDLYVIEDAAQAIGAEYKDTRAGSIGHLGCFSFFPSKNLGGYGDGGMVTTNDEYLADRIKLLRSHGYCPKYYNKLVGGNFRLDAIQAAVLRVKLKYLDLWTNARQKNAVTYRRLFNEVGKEKQSFYDGFLDRHVDLVLPQETTHTRHIYNQFVIRTSQRNNLMSYLRENNIGCEIYYPLPLHLQECFSELGYHIGDFPNSEQAANETLALPIYPELSEEMLNTVVNCVFEFYYNQSK